jgi:hypothetical protein
MCILLVLITYVYNKHGSKNIKWQVLIEFRVRSIYILTCNVTKKAFSSLETNSRSGVDNISTFYGLRVYP